MPLAERDVNSQHHQSSTRAKRLPAAGHENAPPSSNTSGVRVTPARQRFFAATKASAAKTSPPSSADRTRQPHSNNTTPHSQTPGSRLPCRNVAAPKLTPPTSKWNPTSARRFNHLENTSEDAQVSPCAREAPQTADQSLIDLGSAPAATHHIRAGKPLPSRPIASLADGPSPSKDSRSLVDASERPLRPLLAGSECDWPTLLPTSYSTPTLAIASSSGAMAESPLPSGRLSVSAASLLAASMDITHLADDHYSGAKLEKPHSIASRPSSTLSNASPLDAEQTSERADTGHASMQKHVIYTAPNIASPYPIRTSSLGNRSGDINPMKRSEIANATIAGSTGFARDTSEQSRPHSPSPASFSRPRPTSVSHSSGVSSVTSVVAMTPVRSSKTASRIPLPDQKKATLVDIKARRTSSIPMPKLEKGLSFGGRRIDSPDPLKVLDHGIKRRQLQRANTNGSNSTASTVPTRLIIDDPLPNDRSKANTPDSTMGSSAEEEEEITTPSDRPLHFVKHGYKPKHMKKASTTYHGGQSFNVHDDTEVILGRPPPSNSPFTGPLQTIPSQSMLPLLAASEGGSAAESPCPKVVIKPTEFSTFAQRLSELEDTRALASEDRRARHSLIDVGTQSELVEILRDAKHEDALISQCGAAGLDEETRLEITRTLSMLEGKCDPPTTAVDLGHLSKMFGRLKSGFEKAPKSAAFVGDATAAERFLAKQDAASETAKHADGAESKDNFETPPANYNREGATSPMSVGKTSKWSNSTASIKRQSLPFTEETSGQSIFGLDLESLPPGLPPKDLPKEAPISIGYPSRMPGKAHRLLGTDDRTLKSQKQTTRRVSSPTLGAQVPGSVRAAREKARDAAGSRAYKASDTKVNKMPTSNTKVFSISGDTPRGRNPSTESSYLTNQTKLPRSHSKSRYMLEKINGLFSGRRDRRNSEIPPVPPIKDTSFGVKPSGISQEVRINSLGSPMLKGARAPPLTKMPTISPPVDSVHPALRSAPSLASVAPSNITAGSASNVDYEGRRSLQALSEKLLSRAQAESNPARKERLLSFAKVLNDSIISAREAQISAETAQTAARSAQLSYEMTMRSVTMLQRLASSMNKRY